MFNCSKRKKKFLGTITDGDIRRDILKNKNFSKSIKYIYNSKSTFMYNEDFTPKKVKRNFIKSKNSDITNIK